MRPECDRRRSRFVDGARLRLADGQEWALPGPIADRAYHDTLLAVVEAEDESERLRAELALTIHLLDRNYDLTPSEFRAILGYPPDDPALAEMQRAARAILREHARLHLATGPERSSPAVPRRPAFSLFGLLPRQRRPAANRPVAD